MNYIFSILFLLSFSAFGQETISWDEAKINGKVAMTISKADFDKRFKKADSIVPLQVSEQCGNDETENVRMVYYKGAKYEMDNGIMNFRSVDFSKSRNTYFEIKDDWFDRTTTLKSFTKTYPKAAEFIEDAETEDREVMDMIMLLPANPEEFSEWRFYFLNDRLRSIECWFPCD